MKRIFFALIIAMSCSLAAEDKTSSNGKPYVVYVQNDHSYYYGASPFYRACDFLWQSTKIAAGFLSLTVAVKETINICKNDSWPCRALRRRFGSAWNSDYWTFATCVTLTIAPYILGPMGIRSGWYGLHRSR